DMSCSLPLRPLRPRSPLRLPPSPSLAPLRRRAPFAWLTRVALSLSVFSDDVGPSASPKPRRSACGALRSRGSLALLVRFLSFPPTFAPRTPLHALARRFAGSLRSRGSLAFLLRFLSHPPTCAPR